MNKSTIPVKLDSELLNQLTESLAKNNLSLDEFMEVSAQNYLNFTSKSRRTLNIGKKDESDILIEADKLLLQGLDGYDQPIPNDNKDDFNWHGTLPLKIKFIDLKKIIAKLKKIQKNLNNKSTNIEDVENNLDKDSLTFNLIENEYIDSQATNIDDLNLLDYFDRYINFDTNKCIYVYLAYHPQGGESYIHGNMYPLSVKGINEFKAFLKDLQNNPEEYNLTKYDTTDLDTTDLIHICDNLINKFNELKEKYDN